jgi:trypsin
MSDLEGNVHQTLARSVIVIAVLLVGSASAQEEIRPLNRRIVGGAKTDIKQHPWQVALNVGMNGQEYLCGGSIIAQRWVVTAAHCFGKAIAPGHVRAKAGVTDYITTGVWLDVERVIVHEAYDAKTQQNDIALIKLKSSPAGRVIALAASSLDVPVNQPLEVTGWGATTEGGSASHSLLKAIVPRADTEACNTANAYAGRIKEGMMCAGFRDGGVDSCQGDSGGPLVWRTPDGPVLVGIVSWGDGCARKLRYGVYTRVSAYRDWIDRTLVAGGS